MSLKRLHNIPKTIGFRLTAWYSGIFILSSILLFVFAYYFLSSTLLKQDHGAILSELGELSSEYVSSGITSLEKEVTIAKKFRKKHPFFIRFAGTDNNTLQIFFPYQWAEFDLTKLEKMTPVNKQKWIRLPAMDEEYFLDLASTRLPDGHWLQVGLSSEDRERVLERFRETFAAVMIPLFLLGFLSGSFLSFRALRPIQHLIKTVQSIDLGKMEARVPGTGTGDQLDELVRLFNGMLEKIETLINAMKGSLDNVAHDLRTPMTRLHNIAEKALQPNRDVSIYREALAKCIEESDRILRMLNALMDISEAETGVMHLDRKITDIPGLMHGVVDVYSYIAEEKGLSIHINAPRDLYVTVDEDRVGQVLANLLDNAIKYTLSGGQISLKASRRQGEVVIKIKDTGIGIPREELPRIWDRLYRGDHSRAQKGLGLGLSQVKAIMLAHKGRVDVLSEPGKGSTFSIFLPANH
ncbi:MAG: HAMP domain-containing protein [Proteobacteria bacterium]|nr:HAMP domain-containing protein [Pseudomonadota bacterium]